MRRKVIAGYTDVLSAAPGERVAFKVSCEDGSAAFRATLVRLLSTDDHPDGTPLIERTVDSPVNRSYPARRQPIHTGSYVEIVRSAALLGLRSLTVQAMVWPTTPARPGQTLVATWSDHDATGFALEIGPDGAALRLGDPERGAHRVSTGVALAERVWCLVAARYDADTGAVAVLQSSRDPFTPVVFTEGRAAPDLAPAGGGALLMAAHRGAGPRATEGHFNGRLDAVRLSRRALPDDRIEALCAAVAPPASESGALVGFWDFARDITTDRVSDLSAASHHGFVRQLPTRGVRGWRWSGAAGGWKTAPHEYSAIHFHHDDLHDAAWHTDFVWEIPAATPSGLYAARLESEATPDAEPEWVVVFVRPPRDRATAPIAFLASTATYLAYSHYRTMNCGSYYEAHHGMVQEVRPFDLFLNEHPEYGESVYFSHADDSAVGFSTRLKPILNMRPLTHLWAFAGDGSILAWLDHIGQPVDVITDEDLHAEGVDLLQHYRTVLTGCHPEYSTREMFDALEAFTHSGGRLMYLGGNGFYWRVAFSSVWPGAMECRRARTGVGSWIGEIDMAFTGEPSHLWRHEDRTPNRLVGTGFTAQGFDLGRPFHRTSESFDPRVAFMFEGIGAHEPIGDFGTAQGGAAGQELDRYDPALGSPRHALVVAVSDDHTDNMLVSTEDMRAVTLMLGGTESPLVRADMTFFETPGGGAVFSASSISWPASLPCFGFDNNVARLTGNVLRRFLDPAPFAMPGSGSSPG